MLREYVNSNANDTHDYLIFRNIHAFNYGSSNRTGPIYSILDCKTGDLKEWAFLNNLIDSLSGDYEIFTNFTLLCNDFGWSRNYSKPVYVARIDIDSGYYLCIGDDIAMLMPTKHHRRKALSRGCSYDKGFRATKYSGTLKIYGAIVSEHMK